MTIWDNTPTGIATPEAVIAFLRANIAAINDSTPMSVQMRQDNPNQIQFIDIGLSLSGADITAIEVQFPELVGKIVP